MKKTTAERRSARSGRCRGPGASLAAAVLVGLVACDDPGTAPDLRKDGCIVDTDFLVSTGIGRDAIPALDDPSFVDLAVEPEPEYLEPDTRVIGLVAEGRAYAIPHNHLWYHEIVNLDLESRRLAVTLCPLTGSSLAFDRAAVDGGVLRVSGLLFKSNLVMFHFGDEDSIWPQMLGRAACGPAKGTELGRYPAVETSWEGWRDLHPATLVLALDQGTSFSSYTINPYASYETTDDYRFNVGELDRRRPVKERVVGVPPGPDDPGIAFPYGALESLDGDHAVVEFDYGGEEAIVLWSDAARGGMAFRPRTTAGRPVTLRAADGAVVDDATGSRWTVDGRAVSGRLEGARLEPIVEAYSAYWGAWAGFFAETRLWPE